MGGGTRLIGGPQKTGHRVKKKIKKTADIMNCQPPVLVITGFGLTRGREKRSADLCTGHAANLQQDGLPFSSAVTRLCRDGGQGRLVALPTRDTLAGGIATGGVFASLPVEDFPRLGRKRLKERKKRPKKREQADTTYISHPTSSIVTEWPTIIQNKTTNGTPLLFQSGKWTKEHLFLNHKRGVAMKQLLSVPRRYGSRLRASGGSKQVREKQDEKKVAQA